MRIATTVLLLVLAASALAQQDPYEAYVKASKDFQPVKQDRDFLLKPWPTWTNMPWSYQWTIGYTDDSARWSLAGGYNGAFLDHGNPAGNKLGWINQHRLRFYVDHLAGKGDLHLWDGSKMKEYADQVHGTGVRIRPLNAALADKLKGLIAKRIPNVQASPMRAAYALDDEVSWGHFVHPTMWQVTDDSAAYRAWLKEVYGPSAPAGDKWITYNDIWPKLKSWTVAEFDASPLLDQWSFNDSYWNNFIGELVAHANSLDPATPCGYVGGQAPNAFGGYDYAKLMRKVQFLESYNIGSSQAVIRSFNPGSAMPTVTTHFHKSVPDTIWQTWYYAAHGNSGFIHWVEGWFDGEKPKPWHAEVAPAFLEVENRIAPLRRGGRWIHDGVAVYYSHASIQLSWVLDAEAHGKTWINRNNDHRLGSSHLVRQAWLNMLRDEGLQFNFISYADVIRDGVPKEYKVLILSGCLALSDAEARRIAEFCRAGGTVIADYLPGVWDQHGRGRAKGGALDEMFGVRHRPEMRAGDVFGQKLWVEADQDANFGYKSYSELLTNQGTCIKDESGFNKAVRDMAVNHRNQAARTAGEASSAATGSGQAVLLNLSPQWYNAYRAEGFEAAKRRKAFMTHLAQAGLKRWVWLDGAGEKEHGYEITYWDCNGRTLLFVVYNPEVQGSSTGGGNAAGLKTETLPVTVRFAKPVKAVRDERAGRELGDGESFKLTWKQNEALVLSFPGPPPR